MHFVILTEAQLGKPVRIDLDKVQSYYSTAGRHPATVSLSFGAYAFPPEHQKAAVDVIEVREDLETIDRLVGLRQDEPVYDAATDLRVPLLPGDERP